MEASFLRFWVLAALWALYEAQPAANEGRDGHQAPPDEGRTPAPSLLQFPLRRRVVTVAAASGRHAHAHRLLQGAGEVPVFGDFRRLAYFYADVFIGSTEQRFSVIADTGSSLTAVPCVLCPDCGRHQNPYFDPAASATAQRVTCAAGCPGASTCDVPTSQCGYQMSYAEGSSLRGKLWRDSVYLGGELRGGAAAQLAIPFDFGCGTHEGGLFTTQEADGIMGLGQADPATAIMRALWVSGKLAANVFSLCLSLQGGAFTVGAIDPRLHSVPASTSAPVPSLVTPTRWARMTTTGFYVVTVLSMAIDGVSDVAIPAAGFSSPHTILDSGTTFTYVPRPAYDALRQALASFCAADPATRCLGQPAQVTNEPLCYRLAAGGAGLSSFPSATLELAGSGGGPSVRLSLPPEHLFINMGWDGGAYCLAVYDNGSGGGVIGANAMMGNDVIFDMQGADGSGPRAGFAQSQCVVPTPAPSPAASPSSAAASSSPATSASGPTAAESPVASATSTTAAMSGGNASPTTIAASESAAAVVSPLPQSSVSAATTASPMLSVSVSGSSGGSDNAVPPGPGADSLGVTGMSLALVVGVSVAAGMLSCCALAAGCTTLCRRIVIGDFILSRRYSAVGGGGKAGSAIEAEGDEEADGATQEGVGRFRDAAEPAAAAAPAPAPASAATSVAIGGGDAASAQRPVSSSASRSKRKAHASIEVKGAPK